MNRTAVILSGQARTFARTYANQKWFLYRRLQNPVFFVSVADDADAKSVEILRKDWPEVHIEVVTPPVLEEPPFGLTDAAPYSITPTKTPGVGPLQGLMRQFWHNSRAWKFFTENSVAGDFATIIRCRPDLHFQHFQEMLWTPAPREATTARWGTYGGVNDRFAIMGYEAAEAWFTAYDILPTLLEKGCPFHPETIIAAALEHAGCRNNPKLDAWFAFRRPDSSFEHPVVLPHDLANII